MTKQPDDDGDVSWEASVAEAASAPVRRRMPNAETIEAMQEPVEDLPSFTSVQALFDDLHADDKA